MNATIYYIRLIRPDDDEDLFNELRDFEFRLQGFDTEDVSVSPEEFEQYYTEEATVSVEADSPEDALNTLWRHWNAGSGEESDEFLRFWCEDCSAEFTPPRVQEQATVHEDDYPAHTVTGHRSMKVGDIVTLDGQTFICASLGWDELGLNPSELQTA